MSASHERFAGCPARAFANTQEGLRALVERLQASTPLEQVDVLMEKTGHYQQALLPYVLDLDVAVQLIHVPQRAAGLLRTAQDCSGLLKTAKRDALGLANQLSTPLELGAQVADHSQLVRRAVPPREAAVLVRGLVRLRAGARDHATQEPADCYLRRALPRVRRPLQGSPCPWSSRLA
jgi:hypothetical protein